jgi:pimeloyl-ACP methyl ester carboxylesterase
VLPDLCSWSISNTPPTFVGYSVLKALGWLEDDQPPFNILGHSLGTGVSMILASLVGTRCKRVVLIEAFGSNSVGADEAVTVLLEAAKAECVEAVVVPRAGGEMPLALPSRVAAALGKLKVYPSIEAAARRRQEGNLIGSMTLAAAQTLCERGCVPAMGDSAGSEDAVVFGSDPLLKQVCSTKHNLARFIALSSLRTYC